MKKESLWSKYLDDNEVLNDNFENETDVLIIGGGMAGILSAFYLANSNLKITLLERRKILKGITSKMTAKVTPLQDILVKIADKSKLFYLKSQLDGLKLLKKNIEDYNIECDFHKNTSYLFTIKDANKKKLEKLKPFLDEAKIPYEDCNLKILNLDVKKALKTDMAYEINPIKYLMAIKDNLKNTKIYENENVIEVLKEDNYFIVKTLDKKIKAGKVIFATNYPYFLKPLFFPIKVTLEKSYIGYGESRGEFLNKNFNAINIDKEKHSIRFYKDKMLYLTGSHKIADKVNEKKNFSKVINTNYLSKCDNLWSNMDVITNDYLPLIGEIFPNIYIITGFNTWGILTSHIGAVELANLITGKRKREKYQEIFKPRKRISSMKVINSSINIYESMSGYLKGMFLKNKLVFYNHDKIVFMDDKKSYVVKRKCPHLKCDLLFNSVEKTWDCPCHGSRFDLEGNQISGPSKYDIKINH